MQRWLLDVLYRVGGVVKKGQVTTLPWCRLPRPPLITRFGPTSLPFPLHLTPYNLKLTLYQNHINRFIILHLRFTSYCIFCTPPAFLHVFLAYIPDTKRKFQLHVCWRWGLNFLILSERLTSTRVTTFHRPSVILIVLTRFSRSRRNELVH